MAAWEEAYQKIRQLNAKGREPENPEEIARLVGDQWMSGHVELFGERWEKFSGPWPRSGTMRSGTCFRRPEWGRRTSASGCSFWPTPRANEASQHNGADNGVALSRAVKTWPTPQARDGDNRGAQAKRYMNPQRSNDLPDAVAMFPTPRATDGEKGGPNQRGSKGDLGLPGAVFATPSARDYRSGKASPETMERNSRPLSEQVGGQLNPEFVEFLMNFPRGWTALTD
uniref:Uncharacterized protein n=1 Tax=viral metagenome TaxID=1070528 RepID=A0A6M3L0K8_9ZZZZ